MTIEKKCRVQQTLDQLYGSFIDKIDTNILHHMLTINFYRCENDKRTDHQLIFKHVSAFYFLNGSESDRFRLVDYEPGDVLMLDLLHYVPNGIGEINIKSTKEWTKQCYSSANFVLDMDYAVLFIEADSVEVNGVLYEVGFPKLPQDMADEKEIAYS